MDQYEYLRTAHRVYGKNISELARQTGHSRNTIKKALRGEPWGYKEREQPLFPVLGPYRSIIEEWLRKDKEQPKKHRHTARRVYNRLCTEQGYQGSESNVRRFVREMRMELGLDLSSQVFIACEPEAGQEAEVDWGTATAVLGGATIRLKFFCMRSKFSGKHFVRFYPCERQQAFFDAHIKAFDFFGGTFPVLIYDNLTTAVRKVLHGKKRIEQESFSKFKAYYSFVARFCSPDSGNEKGGVDLRLRPVGINMRTLQHLVCNSQVASWFSLFPRKMKVSHERRQFPWCLLATCLSLYRCTYLLKHLLCGQTFLLHVLQECF